MPSEILKRDYERIFPLNGKYEAWIRDRVSTQQIFKPYAQYFMPLFAHIFLRDNEVFIVDKQMECAGSDSSLIACDSIDGIIKLTAEKGSLSLVFSDWNMEGNWTLSCKNSELFLDGLHISSRDLLSLLKEKAEQCSLVLISAESTLNSQSLSVAKKEVSKSQPFYFSIQKEIGFPAEICERRNALGEPFCLDCIDDEVVKSQFFRVENTFVELFDYASQLSFLEFKFYLYADAFCIVGLNSHPQFLKQYPFSEKTQKFLKKRLNIVENESQKKLNRSFLVRMRSAVRRKLIRFRGFLIKKTFPKGLLPYQAVHYVRKNIKDYRTDNGMSFPQKRWAHKNGYLSWRIPQYGITEETKKNVISDFEYRYLRHINNRYMFWLKDKLTPKYALSEFGECFPGYYYCTVKTGSVNRAVKMMDCPDGYGTNMRDILRLVQEKKILAMKPDEGSHGEGFYCLEWKENSYFLNSKPASEEQVLAILSDTRNQYLITEYIVQHPDMAKLYPGSVNTLRLTTFKKDGRNAQVGNAYFRIGSSKTNGVDNIGAGGMMAYVDVETGYFHDAVYLKGNEIVSCPVHPDTGELIEGYIPNWEYAKSKVVEMANSLPELEYFGFDVAITEKGILLPEINTFPDFPRLDKLTPATMDYLLFKLERKKHMYGYDVKPCKTLFRFQKR